MAPSASAQDSSEDLDGPDTDVTGTDWSEVEPLPGEEDSPVSNGDVAHLPAAFGDPFESDAITDSEAIPDSGDPQVINGSSASIGDNPWQVQLIVFLSDGRAFFTCGGSILRDDRIVTAAHCVDSLPSGSQLTITAGSTTLSITNGQQRDVDNVVIHNSWNQNSYDVALLELARPLNLNKNVQPIAIATPDELAAASSGRATGWGATTCLPVVQGECGGSVVDDLRKVTIPIHDASTCDVFSGGVISTKRHVCAGDGDGTGTCAGDSGGPLTIKVDGERKLVGITSFGGSLCQTYVVFANATFFGPGWVHKKLPTRKCGGFAVTIDLMLGMVPTGGSDVVAGTPWPDVIAGKGGNDRICGMDGSDVIEGNGGDDKLYGGDGYDKLIGGNGDDVLKGGNGKDTLKGKSGSDEIYGNGGKDKLLGGGGPDDMHGGDGDDTLKGGNGGDTLRGDAGTDVCSGQGGNDSLKSSCETKNP